MAVPGSPPPAAPPEIDSQVPAIRVFDILCNGVVLRHGFDIFKEAHGAGRSVTWSIHGLEPDAQGKLNVALTPTRNYACVNAVEVLDESK